ncbi:hypothetical protein [Chitinophaga sp. S165]|uniref:glycine-rich domain-containing protein n=1 Tax=Chitinophaga sp. S165 TaxID=2135462 RepID=UPI0018EEA907|nr:hypothetical protein [Chitinophaga sp. S165]
MTLEEKNLWNKIEAFELDKDNYALKFSDRLARENGWSQDFTLKVIREYKRFIFLCVVCTEGVTPSDAVDQAWHLHLTYTKSYWRDFCRDTLGKEVHHNPTEGGVAEDQKFEKYYDRTHVLYREKFGEEPPADVWLDSDTRFSDIDFVRVNRRTHFFFRKINWRTKLPQIFFRKKIDWRMKLSQMGFIMGVFIVIALLSWQPEFIWMGVVGAALTFFFGGGDGRGKNSGCGAIGGCSSGCVGGDGPSCSS